MSLYFGTTEITNVDCLVPNDSKDITQIFFGDKQVFTVWGEYDGTLPAQFNANGDDLVDYRVYGAAGGVGNDSGTAYGYEVDMSVQSANLFDKTNIYALIIDADYFGQIVELPPGRYTLSAMLETSPTMLQRYIYAKTEKNGAFTSAIYIVRDGVAYTNTVNITSGTKLYIYNAIRNQSIETTYDVFDMCNVMLNYGSTPFPYQPYSNTTTPIYIGDTPLEEDEYVDYGEQKVYRCPNLLDMDTLEPGYLATDGTVHTGTPASRVTDYMEVAPGGYILSVSRTDNLQSGNNRYVNFYNANKEYLSYTVYTPNPILKDMSYTFAINNPNIKYVRITLDNSYTKAVFHIENATPTDPPIPLPALPTVDGMNIVDYTGQSAAVPERVEMKYRKERF